MEGRQAAKQEPQLDGNGQPEQSSYVQQAATDLEKFHWNGKTKSYQCQDQGDRGLWLWSEIGCVSVAWGDYCLNVVCLGGQSGKINF